MGDKPGEVGRSHIINGSLSHNKEFGLYLKVQGEWVKVFKLESGAIRQKFYKTLLVAGWSLG